MKSFVAAFAVFINVLSCLSGCGGGGAGGGQGAMITSANRAQYSEDAIILAARTATSPWIPTETTAAIDQDLRSIRAKYPQVTDIHAFPDYDLTNLIIAVKTSAP